MRLFTEINSERTTGRGHKLKEKVVTWCNEKEICVTIIKNLKKEEPS